jgi:putative transposase
MKRGLSPLHAFSAISFHNLPTECGNSVALLAPLRRQHSGITFACRYALESTPTPRKRRYVIAGYPHHVVNRGNDRRRLFFTDADYEAFFRLMTAGKSRYSIKFYGVVIMPNHFHAMLVPETDDALSGYLQWVTGSYASALRARTNTVGNGHVFQRRFWSEPILENGHFLRVLRYIEANPVRGQLVHRCEQWRWSSMPLRMQPVHPLLDALPFELPRDWPTIVNLAQPAAELDAIRRGLQKNRRRETEQTRLATSL